MDIGEIITTIILNLLITVLAYLLVPIIIIISGKKFSSKVLNRINIANCVVIWILFRIIEIEMGNEPSAGGAVVLWGAVNYWLLKKYCLKKDSQPNTPTTQTTAQPQKKMSLSPTGEKPAANNGNILGADIALEPKTIPHHTDIPQQSTAAKEHSPSKSAIKYCSRCGKPIDPISKKCSGCGKQYFKGISAKIFLIGALIICLILSLVLNVVLIIKLNQKSLPSQQTNNTNTDQGFADWLDKQGYGNPSNYDSYNVEIRTITIDNKFIAEYIYEQWKNGEATEASMVAIMNKYGADQGGGQIHLIKPGDLVEEVDSWCFDRTRKIGDVAIIENAYGYTICYFASAVEQ